MSVRVGIGIGRLPEISSRELLGWIDHCDQGPLDSLWQTDRLVSRAPFLESLTTMAAIAGRTRRIKFGMNAVVVPFRDPLLLAKQCATIDFLSGGRLLPVFGVGADDAPEWRASGRGAPAERGARANEALVLMQRLWSEPEVSFEGRHHRYECVSIAPRPVQQPLPCWIGGHSRAAIERTARLGSGWLAGTQSPSRVRATIAAIVEASRRSGRRIAPDHYGASVAFRIGKLDARLEPLIAERAQRMRAPIEEVFAIGTADGVIERLREYHAAGASKFVLIPLAIDAADLIEQTRRLVAEVVPAVHTWADPALPSSPPVETPNG